MGITPERFGAVVGMKGNYRAALVAVGYSVEKELVAEYVEVV
jgi:hypothetical protein